MTDVLILGGDKIREYDGRFSTDSVDNRVDLPTVQEAKEIIRDWLSEIETSWLRETILDVCSLHDRIRAPYPRKILVVTDDLFASWDVIQHDPDGNLRFHKLPGVIRSLSRQFPSGSFLFVFVTNHAAFHGREMVSNLYRAGIDLILGQVELSSARPEFIVAIVEQRLASVQRVREVNNEDVYSYWLRFSLAFIAIPFVAFTIQNVVALIWKNIIDVFLRECVQRDAVAFIQGPFVVGLIVLLVSFRFHRFRKAKLILVIVAFLLFILSALSASLWVDFGVSSTIRR